MINKLRELLSVKDKGHNDYKNYNSNLEVFLKELFKNPLNDTDLILSKSLDMFTEEVKLKNIALSYKLEDVLIRITRDTELRWRRLSRRLFFRCSSCSAILNVSECGRFECKVCDEIMMIDSKVLNNICSSCISYNTSCPGNLGKTFSAPKILKVKNKKEVKQK